MRSVRNISPAEAPSTPVAAAPAAHHPCNVGHGEEYRGRPCGRTHKDPTEPLHVAGGGVVELLPGVSLGRGILGRS